MKNLLKKYLNDYDFRMTVYYSEHNGVFDTHSHRDFYELVLVRSGKAEQLIGGIRQKLNSGDIFIIPPRIEHSYEQAEKFEIYNVLFSRSFFRYFEYDLRNFVNYRILFPEFDNKNYQIENFVPEILTMPDGKFFELDRLAGDISRELESSQIGSKVGALSDFLKIILLIIRYAEVKNGNKRSNKNLKNIGNLLVILDTDYMKDWNINSMAKVCNMQVNNFRLKFKEELGLSPINYLMKLRIEKAIELLKFSQLNVSEISNRVGFNDSNYFSRQFTKYVGRSPRNFLKER
jgi:AraC-like DNA-binding protein